MIELGFKPKMPAPDWWGACVRGAVRAPQSWNSPFIAPVFFLLIFAVAEIGIIFFAQSTLQHATQRSRAGDPYRSGSGSRPHASPGTPDGLYRYHAAHSVRRQALCRYRILFKLRQYRFFTTSLTRTATCCRSTISRPGRPAKLCWCASSMGGPCSRPGLTPFLGNMASSEHLLYSAAAFRNEPFTTGLSGC